MITSLRGLTSTFTSLLLRSVIRKSVPLGPAMRLPLPTAYSLPSTSSKAVPGRFLATTRPRSCTAGNRGTALGAGARVGWEGEIASLNRGLALVGFGKRCSLVGTGVNE